ncbi:MAG TPA: peptide deformylase [Bacteroidetes bacterium]|nr:peptide deformylase [Bacteroidota bacterium]
MIYPILAFGQPILRKRAKEIDQTFPKLEKLLEDMYETMYNAKGVGLAAPQIGKPIRVFIVDGSPIEGDPEEPEEIEFLKSFKQVFINPVMLEEIGEEWAYDEGCLSIPDVIEEVFREEEILIRYTDENWEVHEKRFTGIPARIIQHEYDHLEGKLFTDYVTGLRKKMIKSRLLKISKGKYKSFYPMSYVNKK